MTLAKVLFVGERNKKGTNTMKTGICKKSDVIKELEMAVNSKDIYDEKKTVIHIKRKIITKKIHLKENFALVFFLNNALLQKEPDLKPINSSSLNIHPSLRPEDATWYTEWEYANVGMLIRNSRIFRKRYGKISSIPEAFVVTKNGDPESSTKLNLFEIAERVRLVTNKHEYDLI